MKALQPGQQEDLPVYFVTFFQGWVCWWRRGEMDGCKVNKSLFN